MANGGRIDFEVGFNVNIETLKKASQEIHSIQSLVADDLIQGGDTRTITEIENGLKKAKIAAQQLGDAFDSSFNKDLGVMNVAKFQQQLQKSGITLRTLQQDLQGAGDVGTSAFRQICNQILTTNNYIKKTDSIVSKIATTLGNTLKWNISSSAINKLSGSIQQAWGFTKALDSSLNDIQIVTSKSSEDMKKFAIQANDAAKALGTTTTAYTNAALTFYQQGLSDEDVAARAETSLKVSNVTGLSGDQSAEYVTAVLNGYKVAAEDAENAMDKLAAVGAHTASSLAELSEAMAKVASSANAMGVSEDQLAATLATVISVTRQDASTVGTAFKTIYARISDIKAGSEEAEISLGNYTKKMAEMGFSVLDSAGNMRDLGEVMEEIGGKWETLTREQQISLAQTMAGTRQYNNLIALFDNWAQYEDALNVSMDANGTLQKQQEIYAESYTAKLNELTAAKEKLFMSFVDNDGMKDLITDLTKIIDQLGIFIEKIGGGKTVLQELGIIAMKVFDKQISSGIANLYKNIKGVKQNQANDIATMQLSEQMRGTDDKVVQAMAADYEKKMPNIRNMSTEEQNATLELLRQKGELETLNAEWEENAEAAEDYFNKVIGNQAKIDFNEYDEKSKYKVQDTMNKTYDAANQRMEGLVDAEDFVSKQLENAEKLNQLKEERLALVQKISASEEGAAEEEIAQLNQIENEIKEISTVAGKGIDLIPEGELKNDIKRLQDELSRIKIDPKKENYQKIYEKLKQKVEQGLRDGLDKGQAYLDGYTKESVNQANVNRNNANTANTNVKNIIDEGQTQQNIKMMLDLAAGIGQVAMAIKQVQALGNIWADEDLSTGEKILQTMMTLSMIIPGLITLYNGLKAAQLASIALKTTDFGITSAQVAAERLVALAKGGNAAATKKLAMLCGKSAVAKLTEAGATTAETEAELANIAAKELNAKASGMAGKALSGLSKGLGAAKAGLATVGISAGVAAGAIAGLVAAYAIWKWNKKQEQKEREETAKKAQAQADASYEAAKAYIEENNNIHNLISSYDQLKSKYDGTTKSLQNLQTETSKLLKEYGLYDEAVRALCGDYEDLNNMMNDITIESNNKVIESSEKSMQDTSRAVTAKMIADAGDDGTGWFWKYASETSDKTRSDVDDVFSKYDIQNAGDMEDIITALMEHGEQFREDLAEADKSYAEVLFNETDKYADLIGKGRETAEAKQDAKLENLGIEKTRDKDIKDIKSFDKSVEELKQAALDSGEFLDPEEAENWARSYVASINDVTASIEGYKEIIEDVANEELPLAQIDSFKERAEASKDDVEYLKQAADNVGISLNEAINQTIGTDGKFTSSGKQELADMLGISTKDIDWDDLELSLANMRNIWYDDFNDMKITYGDFVDLLNTENPLAGSWMDPDQYDGIMNDIIQKGLEDGTRQIYSLFTKEDWKEILNAEEAEEQERILTEKIENHLKEFRERFKASTAASLDEGIQNLIDNADRYTQGENSNIVNDEDFNKIQENTEALKLMYPELEAALDIINDKEKVGTEEWLASLEKVQGKMSAIATSESGIYTSEDGAASINALDQAYVSDDISEDDYNAKFMATLEAETESLELDTEAVKNNAEALQDMALSSDEVADSLAEDSKAALKVAKDNARMNKGLEKLGSNFKDLADSIKNSGEGTEEYTSAMTEMKDIMGDVLNIDPDMMSTDFIVDNLDLIQKAAKGDTEAIQQLRVEASNDILMNVMGVSDFSSLDEDLQNEIAYVNQLAADNDFEIGASLDDSEFLAACMDIVNQAGMTAEQATAYLASMGIDATVTEVPVEETATRTVSYPVIKQVGGFYTVDDIKTQTFKDTYSGSAGVALEVSNATYTGKSGGTVNRKNTSGGKGKGGGGGGSKPKEPDKMDKSNDEIDRYHDINIAIKQLETQFDRLGKAQNKLIGKDLINNLNQQLKILEKQIDAYKTKIALERQEAAELQGDLGAKGVKFNDNGTIANYAESLKAQEDYVNSLIDKYNGMSAEEQEAYKEVVEKAKKDYEKFKENIDRYDTIITEEIPGLEDQIQDAVDQQIEINIKKFTMGVEIRLEMKEAEQDWNKFKRKIIDSMKDDNILGQGLEGLENLRDYFDLGDGVGTVQSLTNQVSNTMAEIEKLQNGGTSDVYGDNMAAALEDLQKYNSDLMTQLEDIDDLIADIEQGYLDTIDEINEKMEEQIEAYEYVNDLIESDIELVKLLYGEDAYDSLGAYYSQKHDNYLKAIDFDRKEVDFWEEEMNRAKSAGDTEAYNKALESYRESVSKLNEDVESSVQNIIDKYSNAINKIFDNLDKKFTGGKGLDLMQEEWELINTNADRYLDTINSTYEVQKLQNKYKDAIKNTDSTSAQKKLNALMEEEIGMLEKKDKLSQYDIDRANMKYEIALKQIALEEAQKNKSSMRMKRDAQGNYSYVYAGDEEDISSKQQELADAQNQLYNLDKDQYQSNLNDMMSYYADFTDKYKELMLDTTISDEEREVKKAILVEQYGQLINSIQMDNESIRSNLSESTFDMLDLLYETDAASFEIMTNLNTNNWNTMSDEMINKIQKDLVPTWDSSIQNMINLIREDGGLAPACKEAFKEIEQSVDDFKIGLEDVQNIAQILFGEIVDGQDRVIDKNKELINDNEEIIQDAEDQLAEYQKLIEEVKNLAKAYDGVRDAAIRAAAAAHSLAEEINTQSANAANDPIVGPNMPEDTTGGSDSSGTSSASSNDSGDSGDGDGVLNVGDEVTYTGGNYYGDSYGGGKSGNRGPGKKVKVTIIKDDGRPYPIHVTSSDSAYGWLKKEQLSGYKSGGYTGTWSGGMDNDDGRIAMLHQKELVLNAQDTENYLAAVEEMRKLQDEIKNGASMGILGNLFDAIGEAINLQIMDLQKQAERCDFRRSEFGLESSSMSQNIVINADFPDVSDAAEIQKAFDQILGMASQKANNKSR